MLKNKIALITGAGRGIGRAIAIALAKEGAEVVINYNGSEERAKEVKQTIEENGGKASIYKCNVSDFVACEAMIKDIVKEYGHLDILVNNAGITKDGLIMKMKEEDFDSVLNVNLKGTFNTIRHSARQMLKQRSGKIINISSVSVIYKYFYIRIFTNISMNTYRVFFICNVQKRIAATRRNTARYEFLFSFAEQMHNNVKIVSVLNRQHACFG